MTGRQMQQLLGRVATLSVEQGALQIPVEIVDVKMAYGEVRVEVQPTQGTGRIWVTLSRLTLED